MISKRFCGFVGCGMLGNV